MRAALKREMATVTGLLAFGSLLAGKKNASLVLAGLSAGFYISSKTNHFSFAGKSAYITGGSRGLGLSLAWNLLNQGARVTLVARDAQELERARQILRVDFPGAEIFTSVCDVTNWEELNSSIAEAVGDMQGIDLLINNAGSIVVGPWTSMQRAEFEAQFRLHAMAALESVQAIFPYFKTKGEGRILNICSLGGKIAVPHMLTYDVSKFALAGLSQGLTAELARHNVQVTTAYPTVLRTGSPIQAVFKGDNEKEFRWFELSDNLPMLSMSADKAAKEILQAVREGKTEIVLSGAAKLRLLLGNIFPEVTSALMGLAGYLLPTKDSNDRHTGHESFRKSWFLSALQKRDQKNQVQYNQVPRHSADFNMGMGLND